MSATEADVAAKLIERLLVDPGFRAQFRRDPAAACRAAGLDQLADEMALGAGNAMMTLDVRESKSSLAGVMMAAAMEGVGLYQFSENVLPHIEELPSKVGDVVSRVNLPSIQGALSGGGGGGSSADAAVAATDGAPGGGNGAADAAGAAAGGGGGGGAAAAQASAAPAAPAAPPEVAADGKGGGAAGAAAGGGKGGAAAVPPEVAAADKAGGGKGGGASAADKAAAKIAADADPKHQASSALDDLDKNSSDVPDSSEMPDGAVPVHKAVEIGPDGKPLADAPASPPAPGTAPPTTPAPGAPPTTPAPGAPAVGGVVDPGVVPSGGGGGSPLGAAALNIAQTQKGVHETGVNTGQQVDQYLAAAGVPPGNPWCASFVTWSLQQAGHKMDGGGWGGVATWVHSAEQGSNGLSIVSADQARPGDIVAYDWGGQSDFGADGHIGFLKSTVNGGQFTALEGNNADAVNEVPRHLGGGPNIVFIRAAGDAPAGGGAAQAAAAQAGAVAPPAAAGGVAPGGVATAPVAPGQAAAAAAPGGAPTPGSQDSMQFKAVSAHAASDARSTLQFGAVKPPTAGAAQAGAVAPGAPPVTPTGAAADAAASGFAGGPDAYPGDDASKAQLAAWMGEQAKKRGLPPELPVMASLVESGVRNLNFGDADSVGFFQMRVGTWNQGAYAGFPDDPQKQINWFLDQAEAVKKQRLAAGESVNDPNQYGNWIADIERPAEQYRGRYALRLGEAQGLLKSAPPPSGAPVDVAAPSGAPVEAATPAGVGPHAVIDPTQFGHDGHGGPPDSEAVALLHNKNVILDANGVSDIKHGVIDPRVVAVLTKLSQDHKITVSCTCSDHPTFTTGGSVSNHTLGRGVDIAAVDGVPVNSANFDAREIAMKLDDLNPAYRPNEIGSPWAISGAGYFTDSDHQDHLHIGFKQAIDPNWKPPTDVAATAAAGTPPAVAGVAAGAPVAPVATPPVTPGAPAAAPPTPAGSPKSLAFSAVTPEQAAKAAAASTPGAPGAKPSASESLAFLAVPKDAQQVPAPAAQAGAVAPGAPPVTPTGAAADAAASGFAGGPDAYPGDDASKAQLAAWMGEQAKKRGLPPELPVMASLVESGVRNLNFGDADSVGFFQMRVGTWNQGAYAGFPDDPQKQINWFLDQAEAVKKQRLAAGESVNDPNQYGNWIADIERPAEQYRGRYALRLGEAQGLLKSAPPPSGAVAPAPPGGAAEAVVDAAAVAPTTGAAGPRALAAVQEAEKYLGTSYHWGGSTPQTGFDCSGLMQWAYAKAGIQIPRVTYTQIADPRGVPIDRDHLQPGDLIFFADHGDVHHVGMSLGGDKFIHAPHTGDVVKVSSLNETYYKDQFDGGRRFDTSAPAGAPAAAVAPPVAPPVAAPPVAPAPPVVDPVDVAKAQAAVARDAAEVDRHDSILFKAVSAQEARKDRATIQFLKAVDPKQQVKPAGTPAPAPTPAAPVTPAPAVPPEAAAAPPAAHAAADAGPAPDLSNVDLGDYPGDNAPKPELAKWMAKQAEKAGLPPELPVMASLVESGVKNVNYGDADSVGFFQMRVGIWNRGPYAGFPDNPRLQVKWFIDNALNVKKQRLEAGKPIDDPGQFGDWIADVERPAAQYRYRYQLRLSEARQLLS